MWYFSNPWTISESRRRTSEAESTGVDIGPLGSPAWSGDDQEDERDAATMKAAAKEVVAPRSFMGVITIMGERKRDADNIHGNFD